MLLFHFSVKCNPRQIWHLWILLVLHQNGNASFSLKSPRGCHIPFVHCEPMWLCQLLSCHYQLLFEENISWSFIRWWPYPLKALSVETSLSVDVLAVDSSLSVEGFIRWSFILIRWSFWLYPLMTWYLLVDYNSLMQNYKA